MYKVFFLKLGFLYNNAGHTHTGDGWYFTYTLKTLAQHAPLRGEIWSYTSSFNPPFVFEGAVTCVKGQVLILPLFSMILRLDF